MVIVITVIGDLIIPLHYPKTKNFFIYLCATVYNELPLKNKHLNINWLNVYSLLFHNGIKLVFSAFSISALMTMSFHTFHT